MKKAGFTLIELLGVIAILGILILAVVPNVIKIYNKSLLKTMSIQENNIKNASKLFVEDYCISPIDNSYICPNSYKNEINDEKYVCLSDLQNINDKYINNVTYKKEDCSGVIVYTEDENGGYNKSKTYLYCGYNEDTTSYSYMTDSSLNVKKYSQCGIQPPFVKPPTDESCFAFDSITGTITNYYNNEGNNSSNPPCSKDLIIPSKIGGTNVVAIGGNAFVSKQLTSVVIPAGIITISDNPFRSNSTLTTITVDSENPNYISSNNAIYTKNGIRLISGTKTSSNNILNTATIIGSNSFYNMGVSSLTLPINVTTIEMSAFQSNQITDLTIGSGVITIGGYSFYSNPLTNLTISTSVKTIGSFAFCYNQLTSVFIPANVTNLGSGLFGGYSTIQTMTVDPNNPNYMSSNNIIYTKDGKTLIHGTKNASNSILNTTTNISDNSFGYLGITSVTIPESVTFIGHRAFATNSLTNVIIPSNVTYIESEAFRYNQLTSVIIPNKVTYIGASAFYNNKLTSVTIPASVTSIGNYAFRSNQLTNVYIKGKSLPSEFTTYGTSIWGWASGYSDSNITWNAP